MGCGSSSRSGAGQKVRSLLSHPRHNELCPGMSWRFCRDVPDPWGCSKSLCKKVHADFWPCERPFRLFGLVRLFLRLFGDSSQKRRWPWEILQTSWHLQPEAGWFPNFQVVSSEICRNPDPLHTRQNHEQKSGQERPKLVRRK